MQQDDPRNMFFTQRQQYDEDLTRQTNTTTQNTTQQPKGQTTQNGNNSKPNGNSNADYEQKLAEMKKLAAKYEREGEGQLVKDIVNNVLEQKAAGKLSNEQLIAFAKRVSPLLNADQRARLNGLLEQLLKL